jgi:CRP-like cAMP-binding protein
MLKREKEHINYVLLNDTNNAVMPFANLLKNIQKHVNLNAEEEAYLLSLFSEKAVDKKEMLLHEGQPCHYFYFVYKGALRSYCLDKQGKESTIMFALQNWWITDMFCFLNDKPAIMFIEALQDSVVLQIHKKSLDNLLLKYPKFEKWFRVLMQNAYTREQLRVIDNLTLSAEEKYDKFLAKYPLIVNEITQKQLASYLGITPEFLSVIRKNKL